MKAVLLRGAGDAHLLELTNVPKPQITDPHFIRVRLHAAGINPIDYKMRRIGTLFPDRLPAILGCDGAGVVEAVGKNVRRFTVGDGVYFFNGGIGGPEPGNYAEYTIIHEDYAALKPRNLTMTEAAAVPLVWLTAWEALADRAELKAGQTILIHAGAGGVGHVAIQIARNLGAKIATTVSSPKKAAFAQSLGADYCIHYRETDFVQAVLAWTDGQGVDVVFDTVGQQTFCRSFTATRIYGRVVTLLEDLCSADRIKVAKFRNLSVIYELMLTPMFLKMHEERVAQRQALEKATRHIEEGTLKVRVGDILPLEQVAEAHRRIEEGHLTGKLVLDIVQ
ncbi:alcohol dehydrogenase [Desulfonema ishimotonii]|uniref:Alcohol dehydrogenase n=1 Tax=Desulfonema ishimotonii TaxID=45657 RepID=A0A401FU20_9BACT|nr:zinc-dependent alcohol dehydrogenase family protein [Desulfonema ishimotonii]GBC60477.1 alcohol dehydrogenase [Desulfonema ishimotonii]